VIDPLFNHQSEQKERAMREAIRSLAELAHQVDPDATEQAVETLGQQGLLFDLKLRRAKQPPGELPPRVAE
jgi:hypothetical protein